MIILCNGLTFLIIYTPVSVLSARIDSEAHGILHVPGILNPDIRVKILMAIVCAHL